MAKTSFVAAGTFRAPKTQQDRLRRALDAGADVVVEQQDGQRVSSRELSRLLRVAMTELAAGGEVVVLRSETEVSPAEAGELLGLSRQFVDRLIDHGDLPARRLHGSRHRRVRVADVVAFGRWRDERRASIAEAVNGLVDAGSEY
ncbi:MAG: helix-turn-helix transcriptional regulator [Egibacteraceae bacterium]